MERNPSVWIKWLPVAASDGTLLSGMATWKEKQGGRLKEDVGNEIRSGSSRKEDK